MFWEHFHQAIQFPTTCVQMKWNENAAHHLVHLFLSQVIWKMFSKMFSYFRSGSLMLSATAWTAHSFNRQQAIKTFRWEVISKIFFNLGFWKKKLFYFSACSSVRPAWARGAPSSPRLRPPPWPVSSEWPIRGQHCAWQPIRGLYSIGQPIKTLYFQGDS